MMYCVKNHSVIEMLVKIMFLEITQSNDIFTLFPINYSLIGNDSKIFCSQVIFTFVFQFDNCFTVGNGGNDATVIRQYE